MRFMMMVKGPENAGMPPKALMDAIDKMIAEDTKSGKLVSFGGLYPTAAGFRVRSANGKISVTDGPFTEAKEVIGGFSIYELKSKEEAIEWAKRAPMPDGEMIEVRQVQEIADFPPDVRKAAGH